MPRRRYNVHEIQSDLESFRPIADGLRRCEVVKTEFRYPIVAGDYLWIREWDQYHADYTGAHAAFRVAAVDRDDGPPGLIKGYSIIHFVGPVVHPPERAVSWLEWTAGPPIETGDEWYNRR